MSANLQVQNATRRRFPGLSSRDCSAHAALASRQLPALQHPWTEYPAQRGRAKTQIQMMNQALAHTGSGLGRPTSPDHPALGGWARRSVTPEPDFVFVPPNANGAAGSLIRTAFAVNSERPAAALSRRGSCLRLAVEAQRVVRRLAASPRTHSSRRPQTPRPASPPGQPRKRSNGILSNSPASSPVHAPVAAPSDRPTGPVGAQAAATSLAPSSFLHREQRP